MSKNSGEVMSDKDFSLFKQVIEMTYGSQEEIKNRAEGSGKHRLTSVLLYKPIEQLSEQIIDFYRLELKGLGITNSTWDEKLWAFRANIEGALINKLKERGFIVLLDRKIEILPDFSS